MYTKQSKIGVIGSGIVGQVLAHAFLSEGNTVMLGTRDPAKEAVVKWQKENPGASVGSFEATAQFANIIVLAVNGEAAEDVVKLAGTLNFNNKILIDTTNPISHTTPPVNGVLPFFTDHNHSLAERIQSLVPGAKLVKAFNSVGNALMYKPTLKDTPTMFICGNDGEAKNSIKEILTAFGWETADMGAIEAARAIEPLCMLWCIPGLLNQQWNHAFKLLKP